ncbi:MAG TPA: Long-chain fatty acid transport protein [Pseudomonas sp.]|uniref:OmpP1/FadL family transporter n=1 Tax=Stutzerimonas frequens TaxID=2968969 RepID=UPI0007BA9EF3|nr:outer membrane protein transport protein [Stutzerimonas frequens]KZX59970.1 Long-chain fatty acid transport protein [Stutzerimonas frequens]MAL90935.1 Long-chain fatty acid transport protein [Pseudomonas sp.]QFU11668.1 Long-chain fatty acid transport protein precursor [Stutzerimonas frequens]HAW62886.1 Long-chain fatty acid transport protein [Pseudomonas sp.]|tara:strand:+ start:311 stop:1573 length:1263 start_codon:yes stop_codon:yes gene_type:complete
MKTTWLKTALAVAVGALSSQAMAAGFALNEQSISGMGTSFAGRSSSADDATTLFGNPAGMSRLKREEVSFGMAAIHAKTDIKDTSGATAIGTPVSGSNDGDMVPFTAVPMGYYVKPIDDKWALGVGVYVPFGLITDYESGFQGRYHGDYSEVRVITVQPTVSYRFNDKLSIGFGPTINRIDGELQSATFTGGIDGRVKVTGDDTAVGFNAGILYEFTPHTRMGLTYHSKVDYTLEGDTELKEGFNLSPLGGKYDASLDLTTPESIDLSVTHELNDQWTLYAGAMLTRWSRFEAIVIENEGIPASPLNPIIEEQDWHDTWSYALGAAYKLNREWTLRTGLAFDQSPTNNEHRSPRIPSGDRTAVSFGLAWNPTDDVTVDLAYSYLWEEDTKVRRNSPTRGVYNADYENRAHGFGAALSYRF